ncbi:MAG TPA: PilZ domain-containing protein [Nitrospiraceae bacterium]|nr:PilZ domain-containing protein [Nitrospiraceae bacterium]
MKLPVVATKSHQGKSLELDTKRETIALLGSEGQVLGVVGWGAIIDYISFSQQQAPSTEARTQPRVSLTAKVRYLAPNGSQVESRATGVGGGGLFIESTAPMAVGTEFTISFALPDRSAEWLEAKGKVAWVCPKADQYTFFPGMGVRFTSVAPDTRARMLEFVNSLKKSDSKG